LSLISEGESMLRQIKLSLDAKNMASMQENEIRKVYFVAKERLRDFIRVNHAFYTIYSMKSTFIKSIILLRTFIHTRFNHTID
jgi:hypothetical protein